jgi:hypothetical protein
MVLDIDRPSMDYIELNKFVILCKNVPWGGEMMKWCNAVLSLCLCCVLLPDLCHAFGDPLLTEHPTGIDYEQARLSSGTPLRPLGEVNSNIQFFDGKIECSSCHTATPESVHNLVMSDQHSSLCLACHLLDDPGVSSLHGEVIGSKHDFSLETGFGSFYNQTDTLDRMCIWCHAPHYTLAGENAAGIDYLPLWNHAVTVQTYTTNNYSGSQPGSRSRLCLSCHDRTVPVNEYGFPPGDWQSKGAADSLIPSHAGTGVNGDLFNHHPLGQDYEVARISGGIPLKPIDQVDSRIPFYNGDIECSSCHIINPDGADDLVISEFNSALCLGCHQLDGTNGGANIIGSGHDLSNATGLGALYNQTDYLDRRCIYCHAPHHAIKPLDAAGIEYLPSWNHKVTMMLYNDYSNEYNLQGEPVEYSIGQPGDHSRLCLSCHDGSVAVNDYGFDPGRMQSRGAGDTSISPDYQIGANGDLSGSHPVGFSFTDGSSGVPGSLFNERFQLYDGKVECATCHDPHDALSAVPQCTDCHQDNSVPAQPLVTSSPHGEPTAIVCNDCHDPHGSNALQIWPPLPLLERSCSHCHTNNSGGGYTKNAAPLEPNHSNVSTLSGKYGVWSAECWDCHAVHTLEPAAEAFVEGTYTGFVNNQDGTTTFMLNSFTVNDPVWQNPSSWAVKTGNERGLILWTRYRAADTENINGGADIWRSVSFEVLQADANSVTVNGTLSLNPAVHFLSNNFELHYGQQIRTQINNKNVVFNGPDMFAANDGLAGDLDGDGLADDASADGVCQGCHTATLYWRNDGSRTDHFSGQNCTNCHRHENGFRAGSFVQANPGNDSPVSLAEAPEVNLVLPDITTAGVLGVMPVSSPASPADVRLVPGTKYAIDFSGVFNGAATVCIDYDPAGVSGLESALALHHYNATDPANPFWEYLPATVNEADNTVCGTTTSFSVFAVVEADSDGDSIPDSVDGCPHDPLNDIDGDGVCADADGCPYNQEKTAASGLCGCGYDQDADGDGVFDCQDNCTSSVNPGQEDSDGDGIGDACDSYAGPGGDLDLDGIVDAADNCPIVVNPGQEDLNGTADGDGVGDACEDYTSILQQNFDQCATRTPELINITRRQGHRATLAATGAMEGQLTLNWQQRVEINSGAYSGWSYARAAYTLVADGGQTYTGFYYIIGNDNTGEIWGSVVGDILAAGRMIGNSRRWYLAAVQGVEASGTIRLELTGTQPPTSVSNFDTMSYLFGDLSFSGTSEGYYSGPWNSSAVGINLPELFPDWGFALATINTPAASGSGWGYFHDEGQVSRRFVTWDGDFFGISYRYWQGLCPSNPAILQIHKHIPGGGVEAVVEDAAPNNGDANGDSTPDSLQDNVASLASAATAAYVTVDSTQTAGTKVTGVDSFTENELGDDPLFIMPLGAVRFDLTGLTPGATAVIRLYFSGITDLTGYVYRKYDPLTNSWTT